MKNKLLILLILLAFQLNAQVNQLAPFQVELDACPYNDTLIQVTITENEEGVDPIVKKIYSCRDSFSVGMLIHDKTEDYYTTQNRFEARANQARLARLQWDSHYTHFFEQVYLDSAFNRTLPLMQGQWYYSRNETSYIQLSITNDSVKLINGTLVGIINQIQSFNGFSLQTQVDIGSLPSGSIIPFRRNAGNIFIWIDDNDNTYTLRKISS